MPSMHKTLGSTLAQQKKKKKKRKGKERKEKRDKERGGLETWLKW